MPVEIVMDGAWPNLFEEFVAFKRGVGYAYPRDSLFVIRFLSRHLANYPAVPEVLSREAAESFYQPNGHLSDGTLRQRRGVVRQFALFLRWKGIDSWTPPEAERRPGPRFTPRIITVDEMALVIARADEAPSPVFPASQAQFAMLIRMLWCCGLRIGEAVALTIGDVDLGQGVLTIRNGKGGHARLVPMSGSLAACAGAYARRTGLPGRNPASFFYPSPRGGARNAVAASARVRAIMAAAGVTADGVRSPRTHDIRHSYAVEALRKMEREGLDPYASLPLLSAYLGHRDIQSTEYYLRLTGPMSLDAATKMAGAYQGVFPEVD